MCFSRRLFFLVCFLVMAAPAAQALDYSFNGDLTLFRGYRILREHNASDYLSMDDSVGVFGLGAKLESPHFIMDVKGRLIAAYGPGVGLLPTDPAYLDVSTPPRYLKWEKTMTKEKDFQSISEVERAYLLFRNGNFEMSAGRRAVGIGTLKYLPIWNRFIPSIGHVGGPALIYNPDDIQISYQLKKVALSAIHIQGRTDDDNISILVNTWYLDWIELHLLGGSWYQRPTGGFAFVKDLEGLTIRGEALFFRSQFKPQDPQQQTGLGLEYAFNSKFSIVTEGMYSSLGATRIQDYNTGPRDKFEILNADAYVFGLLEYMPFDFWKFSAGPLVNLVDSSFLGIAEVKYNWSENLDISLQLKQPVGSNGDEFGSDFVRVADDANFGYSQQIAAQLNYYF